MDVVVKGLIGIAALAFVVGVIAGVMGGGGMIMNIPAESFSRACDNLALIAIALSLMAKGG